MSLDKFKQRLRKKLDDHGFLGVSDLLLEIEQQFNYSYDKTGLSNLRSQIRQPGIQGAPDIFLVGVKAYIDSICELDITDIPHYKKAIIDNQVFRKFIFLDRHEHLSDLRNFCSQVQNTSGGTKVYQVRSENCHRGDWLFYRLRLHIEMDKENFFHERTRIHHNLNFKDFLADLRSNHRKMGFKPKYKGHVLDDLSSEQFHLLPFVIDTEEEDKQLDDFIQNFYDFWETTPPHINGVVLLAVNILNRKPSLWKKLTKRKYAPSRKPNITNLPLINKRDVKILFEDIACEYLMNQVQKEEASIEDFWEHLHPLICKTIG